MPIPTKIKITPEFRDYLYPVALAVIALLGGYGLIAESKIPLWIALVSAVLGLATATVYRPSKTLDKHGFYLEHDK